MNNLQRPAGCSPRQFWQAIGDQWTEHEHVSDEYDYWLYEVWRSGVAQREYCMTEPDRTFFNALPDRVTIYRGVGCEADQDAENAISTGLSWTLSKAKAIWFARRFNNVPLAPHSFPYLGIATIRKKQCVAYFSGREEQEIVIDPEFEFWNFDMKKLRRRRARR